MVSEITRPARGKAPPPEGSLRKRPYVGLHPVTLVCIKLPRVESESCQRRVAADIVAGRPTKGRIWRHDPPPRMRSLYGGSLVSCAGLLVIVDLPLPVSSWDFVYVRACGEYS